MAKEAPPTRREEDVRYELDEAHVPFVHEDQLPSDLVGDISSAIAEARQSVLQGLDEGEAQVKLDPLLSDFSTAEEAEAYEIWLRSKVEQARNSSGPGVPHDQVMAELDQIILAAEARRVGRR